jgi:hypothetical protein
MYESLRTTRRDFYMLAELPVYLAFGEKKDMSFSGTAGMGTTSPPKLRPRNF